MFMIGIIICSYAVPASGHAELLRYIQESSFTAATEKPIYESKVLRKTPPGEKPEFLMMPPALLPPSQSPPPLFFLPFLSFLFWFK